MSLAIQFKTSLIKLEVLKKEYENILQQYQEAINNYILNISTDNYLDTSNQYVFLKGRTWWGTSGISQMDASSQEICKSMCASDLKCSGATFNEVKKYCWTRTGEGKIAAGYVSDYAIISKQKESSINLKMLNNRLIQLNQEILTTIKLLNPNEEILTKEMNTTYILLIGEYTKLLEQKDIIDKQIQEYLTIEETLDNQELYVIQQNTIMRFWMIIACLILLFTLKGLYGNGPLPIEITFWFIIILLLLVLSFTLRTPGGFFIFFIIIFYIIFLR
jgi:hypothetical protein